MSYIGYWLEGVAAKWYMILREGRAPEPLNVCDFMSE